MLVTFDLDNTLWDVDPTLMRAELAMRHWFEDRFPNFYSALGDRGVSHYRHEVLLDEPAISFNVSRVRLLIYTRMLKDYGLPAEEAESFARMAFDAFYDWRQRVDLYPGARDVLQQLRDQYAMAVITNGNADVHHPHISLNEYFEFALRADQVGVAKPDPEIFVMAAKQKSVPVTSLIHVGDNPDDDIFGALNAGARAIWFNRHGAGRWLRDDCVPDAEIHNLYELPEVLAQLG